MEAAAPKPLDAGTRLAVDRTLLAHERTLMAWIRTALSLITFGFTVYKFFQYEAGKGLPAAQSVLTPRHFGMIMIGTGLTALVFSLIDHRRSLNQLRTEYHVPARSASAAVAAIVSAMGLFAFIAALLRL